jgi:hypothetical protein
MQFFLGTPEPAWLKRTDVPLFVSHNRLRRRKTLPRARGAWALDSGGFTQLSMHGQWTIPPQDYVQAVRRYADEIGRLQWAALQDWMCEPVVIHGGTFNGMRFKGTGLSVQEHQRRTVANYLELRSIAPELPFIPVLQGWERDEYLRCVEMYFAAGVDLQACELVGLGSVCRRQGTKAATDIISTLASLGLRLHGFGFKVRGLHQVGALLASADSMAWSYQERCDYYCAGKPRIPWRSQLPHALAWRERIQTELSGALPGQYKMAI